MNVTTDIALIDVARWVTILLIVIFGLLSFNRLIAPYVRRANRMTNEFLGSHHEDGFPDRPGVMERLVKIDGRGGALEKLNDKLDLVLSALQNNKTDIDQLKDANSKIMNILSEKIHD